MAQHPLDPLSEEEFRLTAAILRRDQGLAETWRFASIELREPAKADGEGVAARRAGAARRACACCGTAPTTRPGRAWST